MGFQSVPDTASFTARFSGPNGRSASITVYSRNTAAPWDASQLAAIGDQLVAAVEDDYMPVVSSQWTFVDVLARDLEVRFGRTATRLPAAPVAGTLASPALPNNVAVGATFVGNPGAAPARGGIRLLPPAESQVVGSLLEAASVPDLQGAADAIAAAMSGGGAAHVIVSRYEGTTVTTSASGKKFREPIKRAVAVTNTVSDVLVKTRVDSQRKRLPREVA